MLEKSLYLWVKWWYDRVVVVVVVVEFWCTFGERELSPLICSGGRGEGGICYRMGWISVE